MTHCSLSIFTLRDISQKCDAGLFSETVSLDLQILCVTAFDSQHVIDVYTCFIMSYCGDRGDLALISQLGCFAEDLAGH